MILVRSTIQSCLGSSCCVFPPFLCWWTFPPITKKTCLASGHRLRADTITFYDFCHVLGHIVEYFPAIFVLVDFPPISNKTCLDSGHRLHVFFHLFYRALLQKRPIILRSLLIVISKNTCLDSGHRLRADTITFYHFCHVLGHVAVCFLFCVGELFPRSQQSSVSLVPIVFT